ncbi:sodium bile acid symporter family-domain-containing protein [Pavlovales sp. CCMP2436]|nr:sodium bile acid symporter family-domain-containing protein [Pavlovales sp. CCMP2436]|mmetsp:Transcript_5903/g.15453  ORF Transcript_5903/g.15453 Transcript_5903/m.15453 type:complete len:396 (-) Transcript_5903:126-1313(-)
MVDQARLNAVLSNVFLFILIVGMAGTTDLKGFRTQIRNARAIGTGLACQFLLLPFLGFSAIKLFNIERIFGVMLLIVTSSPGGGFSGWWCSLCNADLALSVAMTTISTLFSVALLPLNIFIYVQALYGLSVPLNWGGIMTSVAVVIGGVITGLACGTLFPAYKRWFNRLGTVGGVANIIIGITAATASGGSSSQNVLSLGWRWYVGIAAPCVLGLIVAYLIARMLRCSGPESVAICIECCYQNTALAIAVAVSVFPGDQASRAILVPLYYGIVEICLIAVFALAAWQLNWTLAPRTDSLLKCVSGNYQIGVEPEDAHSVDAAPPAAPSPVVMTPFSGEDANDGISNGKKSVASTGSTSWVRRTLTGGAAPIIRHGHAAEVERPLANVAPVGSAAP